MRGRTHINHLQALMPIGPKSSIADYRPFVSIISSIMTGADDFWLRGCTYINHLQVAIVIRHKGEVADDRLTCLVNGADDFWLRGCTYINRLQAAIIVIRHKSCVADDRHCFSITRVNRADNVSFAYNVREHGNPCVLIKAGSRERHLQILAHLTHIGGNRFQFQFRSSLGSCKQNQKYDNDDFFNFFLHGFFSFFRFWALKPGFGFGKRFGKSFYFAWETIWKIVLHFPTCTVGPISTLFNFMKAFRFACPNLIHLMRGFSGFLFSRLRHSGLAGIRKILSSVSQNSLIVSQLPAVLFPKAFSVLIGEAPPSPQTALSIERPGHTDFPAVRFCLWPYL